MQKTWRASDIVIVLLLATLILMSWLQMNQAERNHRILVETLAVQPAARPRASNGSATAGDEEKIGDWLVRHFSVEPETLNPLTSGDVYGAIIHDYLYDTLIERDPDTLEWRGEMAESWTVSDDKLTITFKLRDGIFWSDGKPLSADDVVFSYETVKNPEIDALSLASYLTDAVSARAVDRLTVEFKFRKPYFKSVEVAGAFLTVVPRHVYEPFVKDKTFNDKRDVLVGSGPYVFESWTAAQEVVIRRNDLYWGKPGHFDKIVFRIVQEDTAAMQKLRAQEIDRMGLTAEQFVGVEKDEKFNTSYNRLRYPAPGNGFSYIAWNNDNWIFKDRRVRVAMTHLVPREKINQTLLHGLAQVVTGPFWPGAPNVDVPLQYDASIEPYPFDPLKALALLREAGWQDTNRDGLLDKDGRPFSFKILVPAGSQTGLDIASVVKEEMGKVGIQMEVQQMEWTVFVTKLDKRDYDAITLGWSGGLDSDPYQIWHSSMVPVPEEKKAGSNHVGFRNAEADRLMEEARREFDPQKRNAYYHRLHRILHEEQPYTFLYHNWSRAAVHKRFEGVTVHALGLDDKEWWTPREKRRYTP